MARRITEQQLCLHRGYPNSKGKDPLVRTGQRQRIQKCEIRFAESRAVIPEIRNAVRRIDARVPVSAVATMSELIESELFAERGLSLAASVFAVLACILAGVGLYGVMACLVAQRRREFGIRLALGASSRAIARMVLREGIAIEIGGLGLGMPCAFVSSQWGREALYGLHAMKAGIWVTAAIGILLVTTLTAWIPARVAARIDPQMTLKDG